MMYNDIKTVQIVLLCLNKKNILFSKQNYG